MLFGRCLTGAGGIQWLSVKGQGRLVFVSTPSSGGIFVFLQSSSDPSELLLSTRLRCSLAMGDESTRHIGWTRFGGPNLSIESSMTEYRYILPERKRAVGSCDIRRNWIGTDWLPFSADATVSFASNKSRKDGIEDKEIPYLPSRLHLLRELFSQARRGRKKKIAIWIHLPGYNYIV